MRCLLGITLIVFLALPLTAEVPKIIFDADMTGDCDDCGALAILHALADATRTPSINPRQTSAPTAALNIPQRQSPYGRFPSFSAVMKSAPPS